MNKSRITSRSKPEYSRLHYQRIRIIPLPAQNYRWGGVERGEGLDGEGLGELFGFVLAGFLTVNRLDYAINMVELVDYFLKLAVENGTIGDDDH